MNKHIEHIKKVQESQKNSLSMDSYSVECIEAYVKGLFSFAHFKNGDIVYLSNPPEITMEASPGWFGYKNKLINGTKGKVCSVDYYNKSFRYDILFAFSGSTFCFYEKHLSGEYDS